MVAAMDSLPLSRMQGTAATAVVDAEITPAGVVRLRLVDAKITGVVRLHPMSSLTGVVGEAMAGIDRRLPATDFRLPRRHAQH